MGGIFIDQFMWAYQHYFRIGCETRLEGLLQFLGFDGEGVFLLVGLDASHQAKHPICVEPEWGDFKPADLAGLDELTEQILLKDPARTIWNSNRDLNNRLEASLRDMSRGRAIAELLSRSSAGTRLSFLSLTSARIGEYDIYPLVGLPVDALGHLPSFSSEIVDYRRYAVSLTHAVVQEFLLAATDALAVPDPGMNLGGSFPSAAEIASRGAERLLLSALTRADCVPTVDMFPFFCGIAALPYEGRAGAGGLILCRRGAAGVELALELEAYVPLTEPRAVRKLLETTSPSLELVCDGIAVLGLGSLKDLDLEEGQVFRVEILGRGEWQLMHQGTPFMVVQDGKVGIPRPQLDKSGFCELVERRLGPSADIDLLWEIASSVGKANHGGLLVITGEAASEAHRLAPQAWSTVPRPLDPSFARHLTEMDGGILVDPQGNVHAVGVILDGVASGEGDPGRGSRYNNTIRYLHSGPRDAVVLVVSADGGVDALPRLMPRVSRREVSAAVDEFLAAASNSACARPIVVRAWRRVLRIRFYLDRGQCDALNQAYKCYSEAEESGIKVHYPELRPDPQMDDSYWSEDESSEISGVVNAVPPGH